MKRTLWVASSVAVLALPIGAVAARGIAGGHIADLGSLQQAITAKSVIDLTSAQRARCHLDDKTHTKCSPIYQRELCKCP